MAPTTVIGMTMCVLVVLTGVPASCSEPAEASKLMVWPIAAAALGKPRAIAVRLVSTISFAVSDPGSRPAYAVIPGAIWSCGGRETRAPTVDGGGAAVVGVPGAGGIE